MEVLDKTQPKIEENASWGILGSPSKEDIEKWCNLPAGEFTKILKAAKQNKPHKRKKPLSTFTVYVIKTQRYERVAAVKVTDTDIQSAYKQVQKIDEKELSFGPIKERKYEVTTYQDWEPTMYK